MKQSKNRKLKQKRTSSKKSWHRKGDMLQKQLQRLNKQRRRQKRQELKQKECARNKLLPKLSVFRRSRNQLENLPLEKNRKRLLKRTELGEPLKPGRSLPTMNLTLLLRV